MDVLTLRPLYDAAHGVGLATEDARAAVWHLALHTAQGDGATIAADADDAAAVGPRGAAVVAVVRLAMSARTIPCTTPDEARVVLAACAVAAGLDAQAGLTPTPWVAPRAEEAWAILTRGA